VKAIGKPTKMMLIMASIIIKPRISSPLTAHPPGSQLDLLVMRQQFAGSRGPEAFQELG
jgi:hypothetical protein